MIKQPNIEVAELLQEIEEAILPKIGEKKIRVLVFGPNISDDKPGSKLREYIIKNCKTYDHIVVLAEHEEIRQFYEKRFGSANDLCNMEYHLATEKNQRQEDIVDVIVIIPDSSGSFIELGMFAIIDPEKKDLQEKILILFNKDFEPKMTESFIGLGAKTAYDNGKARTRILNYGEKKIAWNEVAEFLGFRKGIKDWEKVKRAK
jgi:hypothetical protein